MHTLFVFLLAGLNWNSRRPFFLFVVNLCLPSRRCQVVSNGVVFYVYLFARACCPCLLRAALPGGSHYLIVGCKKPWACRQGLLQAGFLCLFPLLTSASISLSLSSLLNGPRLLAVALVVCGSCGSCGRGATRPAKFPLKRRNSSSSVELCLFIDDLDVQVTT